MDSPKFSGTEIFYPPKREWMVVENNNKKKTVESICGVKGSLVAWVFVTGKEVVVGDFGSRRRERLKAGLVVPLLPNLV